MPLKPPVIDFWVILAQAFFKRVGKTALVTGLYFEALAQFFSSSFQIILKGWKKPMSIIGE